MKKFLLLLALPSLVAAQELIPLEKSAGLQSPLGNNELKIETPMPVINNRILTRINGEPISLLDVVRKMDYVFYQRFPQYAESNQARFQFYQMHWKNFFGTLVEEKLILADAKEKGLIIKDADIREELERNFGPRVIENIDQAGLTFEEAWNMIKNSLTVQRMSYMSVQMKAFDAVSPEKLRSYYEEHQNEFTSPPVWKYQLITIRDEEELNCTNAANETLALVSDNLSEELITNNLINSLAEKKATFSVSDLFERSESDISKTHLDILKKLSPGECSTPIASIRESGEKKEYIRRIFYLKDYTKPSTVAFADLESAISDKLLEEAMNEYSDIYIENLKERFGVNKNILVENISEEYSPFSTL